MIPITPISLSGGGDRHPAGREGRILGLASGPAWRQVAAEPLLHHRDESRQPERAAVGALRLETLKRHLLGERRVEQVGKALGPRQHRRDRHERVIAAGKMRRDARPLLALRRRGKPRPHRVEGESAHRVQHMHVIHGDAAEAALGQMPGDPRPRVDKPSVAPVRLADTARQRRARRRRRVALGRRQDQVHVVRHQAIGPALHVMMPQPLGEQIA